MVIYAFFHDISVVLVPVTSKRALTNFSVHVLQFELQPPRSLGRALCWLQYTLFLRGS